MLPQKSWQQICTKISRKICFSSINNIYTSSFSLMINYKLLNPDISTAELYLHNWCWCRNIQYLHSSTSLASKTFFQQHFFCNGFKRKIWGKMFLFSFPHPWSRYFSHSIVASFHRFVDHLWNDFIFIKAAF